MKKIKILVEYCIISMVLLAGTMSLIEASSPNYSTNQEITQVIFKGYVQIQPSYNDNGKHAARGRFTYNNGALGTQRYWTDYGLSALDSKIYSKEATYYDTLDPIAPKVEFFEYYVWVPHGVNDWPV